MKRVIAAGKIFDFLALPAPAVYAVIAVNTRQNGIVNAGRYRTKNIPTAGAILKEDDTPEKQITFDM